MVRQACCTCPHDCAASSSSSAQAGYPARGLRAAHRQPRIEREDRGLPTSSKPSTSAADRCTPLRDRSCGVYRRRRPAPVPQGLEIVGTWHSHPNHPARPSARDRAEAWEGWSYVIVSVQAGEAGERALELAILGTVRRFGRGARQRRSARSQLTQFLSRVRNALMFMCGTVVSEGQTDDADRLADRTGPEHGPRLRPLQADVPRARTSPLRTGSSSSRRYSSSAIEKLARVRRG